MLWRLLIKHNIRLKSDDGFDKSLPPVSRALFTQKCQQYFQAAFLTFFHDVSSMSEVTASINLFLK